MWCSTTKSRTLPPGPPAKANGHSNVHRWYEPGAGRYGRPDPLGLNDDDFNLYGFATENPPFHVDPLGLFSLAPGDTCKGFAKVKRRMRKLLKSCECVRHFKEVLGADLEDLIDGPLPRVKITDSIRAAETPCTEDPGAIWVNPKFCRFNFRPDLDNVILHELGHFADCDEQRFPPDRPTEEGSEAEKACFGFSINVQIRD